MIVCDPRADAQPLTESAYMGVPTIAFCDTDSPLAHVDIAIPCNTKNRKAIGLMVWMLSREVLALRGQISRDKDWDVSIDLFLHKDLTDKKKEIKRDDEDDEDEADEAEAAAPDTRKRLDDAGDDEDEDDDEEEEEDEDAAKWGNAKYK